MSNTRLDSRLCFHAEYGGAMFQNADVSSRLSCNLQPDARSQGAPKAVICFISERQWIWQERRNDLKRIYHETQGSWSCEIWAATVATSAPRLSPESGQTNALAMVYRACKPPNTVSFTVSNLNTQRAVSDAVSDTCFKSWHWKGKFQILVFSNPNTEKGSFRCVKHHDGIMKMNAQRLKHAGELAYGLSLYELEKAWAWKRRNAFEGGLIKIRILNIQSFYFWFRSDLTYSNLHNCLVSVDI
jgi:hypothetical protein